MPLSQEYVDFIKTQLSVVEPWDIKRMFGGAGIFKEGVMFAMITGENKFYLKVDAAIKPEFETYGMKAFGHDTNKKSKMPYYECPIEILEDEDLLKLWAERSFRIALSAKKKKIGKLYFDK